MEERFPNALAPLFLLMSSWMSQLFMLNVLLPNPAVSISPPTAHSGSQARTAETSTETRGPTKPKTCTLLRKSLPALTYILCDRSCSLPPVALVLVRAFPGPLHGFFSQPEQLRLQTLPQSALHHSPSSSPPHKTPSLPPFLNHSRPPPLPYFISRALAEREDLYLSLSLSLERILCDG